MSKSDGLYYQLPQNVFIGLLHSDWIAIPVAACTKTCDPTFRQYAKVGLRPTNTRDWVKYIYIYIYYIGQSRDCANKPWTQGLRRTIPCLRKSTLCAQHIHVLPNAVRMLILCSCIHVLPNAVRMLIYCANAYMYSLML